MSLPSWARRICPPLFRGHLDRLQNSTIGGRVVHGSFWSLTGAVMARGLGLATWVIVGNILGLEGFGELGMLLISFTFLERLSLFGLGVMSTRYVARYRAADPGRASRTMGLCVLMAGGTGLLTAAVLFVCAPWITTHILPAPHLAYVMRVGCILIATYSVVGVLEGSLAGFEAFGRIAVLNLVSGVVSLPLCVFGAWYAGLRGTVWMMAGVAVFKAVLAFVILDRAAVRHGCRVSFGGALAEFKAVFDFSLPVFLSTQTYFAAEWLGGALLFRGAAGPSEMGIYSAATRFQQFVSFIPLYVSRALFPIVTERHAAGDAEATRKLLKYYLLICTGLALACAVVLSLLSKLIMAGYGGEFVEGWPVLVIVSLTMVLLPFRWTIEMIYRSTGAVWYEFLLNVAWTAILVTGMVALRMRGSWKLALVTLAAFLVTNLAGAVHVYFRFYRSQSTAHTGNAAGNS